MIGEKKIGFVVVGAGRMGLRWVEVVRRASGTELVCVVDPDPAAGARVASVDVRLVTTASDAFADSRVAAVIIATPHVYLYENARSALEAGKHVLVEKPGSMTRAQMEKLASFASEKKLTLMVGYTYRYFDAIRRAKGLVDQGRVGAINFIRLRHGHAGRPGYDKEWRMDKKMSGGGVLMDQGVHLLDLVAWFFSTPEVRRVQCATNNLFWQSGVEENAMVMLETQDGRLANLHASITQWNPIFSFEIYGDKGYITVEGLGKKYGGSENIRVGTLRDGVVVKEETIVCTPSLEDALDRELTAFLDAIKNPRASYPNARDASWTLGVVEQAYSTL